MPGFLNAQQHVRAAFGGHAVGLSGQGVGIVHVGADALAVGGVNGGEGSKAAHADDDVRIHLVQKAAAETDGFVQPEPEAQQGHGRDFGHRDGLNGAEIEIAVILAGLRIHLLLGNEEGDVVAALFKFLGYGYAGEKVPPRAAAGNHDVQGGTRGRGFSHNLTSMERSSLRVISQLGCAPVENL